jgi:PEGA domain
VRTQERGFLLNLSLLDITTGRAQQQVFKSVEGDIGDLMRAVQLGVEQLLRPRPADARLRVTSVPEGARVVVDDVYLGRSPLLAGGLPPGRHRVRVEPDERFAWKSQVDLPDGGEVDLDLGAEKFPRRRRWPGPLAAGAAVGAVAALATGLVFGVLATGAPTGSTREEAQADLQRRITYGHVSTGLLIGGGALAIGAGAIVWRFWRDLAGD